MVEIVNRPYAKAFEAFATARAEVLCLSADLTSSCEVDGFRDRHPEQFLSLGMAEQNMLSFAGGLAMQGFRPFIHTFSVFLYRRPYDQLINSIAYSNRKVRLMGFLPGITTPGGITHQAIEDIAVLRAVPNMTILETGDATEVETVLEVADSIDGPVYVRILRGEVRVVPAGGVEHVDDFPKALPLAHPSRPDCGRCVYRFRPFLGDCGRANGDRQSGHQVLARYRR